MKKLVIGILAHVDAGKTTLSEALLYAAGAIKSLGRVDHGDAFLDDRELEKNRGITIFSKEALLEFDDVQIKLVDTPGHVDFSAEMERTLCILDACILVVSSEGVQGHTLTLASLLKRYNIPTFIFVNKMDLPGADRHMLSSQLKKMIGLECVDFDVRDEGFYESIAGTDEELIEKFFEGKKITDEDIGRLISERKIFPVFYGSALKNQGVTELLNALVKYMPQPLYGTEFGAKVYKITHDEKNTRLTFMKITGGHLRVKESMEHPSLPGVEPEKVDQLRVYSGSKFNSVDEAVAGDVIAATGLKHTYAGEGLGVLAESEAPALAPVFTYRVEYNPPLDVSHALKIFRTLEEEDPSLHVSYNEQIGEIHVQLMGKIQLEILKDIVRDRFGAEVDFEKGNVVYKETIKNTVIGIGHYEPLRHYAEVHLLIEPAPRDSGIKISSVMSTDDMEIQYQKQVVSSLEEKVHVGTLMGASLTDVKITLVAGRSHLKHTEGGDMREAAWRSLRHGLMQAESVLLEPYLEFRLELPMEDYGRALNDMPRLFAKNVESVIEGEKAYLTGQAPVVTLSDYQDEVKIYSSGRGILTTEFYGYDECHNAEEVLAKTSYEPEADLENSPDSVFCSHGAAVLVPWNEVVARAHTRAEGYGYLYGALGAAGETSESSSAGNAGASKKKEVSEADELDEIFRRTYGVSKREKYRFTDNAREITPNTNPVLKDYAPRQPKPLEEIFIIDGYNVIHAWDELKELLKSSCDAAIGRLVDIMVNYHGYTGRKLLIVFDAYRMKGAATPFKKDDPISVVFTNEGETADMYIEKFAHDKGGKYRMTVATSDSLEQLHVFSQGAVRMSAAELLLEVERVNKQIQEHIDTLS